MTMTLVLIDGTNYAYRAFFKVPPMTTSAGFQTNALYGFTMMLLGWLRQERPDYLAVAFDARGPTRRKQQYEEYKAQRKPPPPELRRQMPCFREICEALGVPFFELSGYEADDIIATLVHRAASPELEIKIITTDKDLMQLVSDRVVTVDTMRGKVFDPVGVEEKWGVPPDKLKHLLALQGDSSDNVPGVPGIGPKKARDLIREFGSVPELLQQLDKVRNKRMRETLENHAEAARLSLELVTLEMDVPLEMPLKALERKEPSLDNCRALFEKLEFRRFLKELGDKPRTFEAASVVEVNDATTLDLMLEAICEAPSMALHALVGEAGRCTALAVATDARQVWRVDLGAMSAPECATSWQELCALLADPAHPVIGHDVKQTLVALSRAGIRVAGVSGDTRIASHLLNSSRKSYELWDIVQSVLLEEAPERVDGEADLSVQVPAAVFPLLARLGEELVRAGMQGLYRDIELPLVPILADIEMRGIRLDVERLEALALDFGKQLRDTELEIEALVGEQFNPNSPKQLRKILFDTLGLPIVKKTRTGPSTDQSVLESLAARHPLPERILEYRSVAKLKNTYADTLPRMVDDRGRIHTTLHQTVVATGRLSSSDPNLQNIPIRDAQGRKIREAFVVEEGFLLLSADYSQIELRLLAHFCEDEALNRAFLEGADIHAATATEIFGVAPGLVSSQMRRSAKAVNFGILYGMGAFRLGRDLKISRKEAEQYIARYFERYPRVREYLDRTLEKARKNGYVTTLRGRRRYLPELSSTNFNSRQAAERMAINTPIQGSAADIIKMAMIKVRRDCDEQGIDPRMVLQVHDELMFEVPEDRVVEFGWVVKSSMESVVTLRCPLVVDIGHGANWAEAH